MPDKDVDLGEVRRWAKDNGIDVADKGAIAKDVIEKYKNRDSAPAEPPAPSTSDDAPAGHSDAAGITDEVTTTVTADEQPADEQPTDTPAGERSEDDGRYRAAWLLPEDTSDEDVERLRATRNRVSVQTLENGFIHYQRHAGTDEVQARLAARGFFNGTAHGHANEDTVQAYARFQDSIGLPGTGIPERTSLEALGFDVLE